MPVTPNAMQEKAQQIFTLFFAAEINLLETIRDTLLDGIDEPRWLDDLAKARKGARANTSMLLAILMETALRMSLLLLAEAYEAGEKSFRSERPTLFMLHERRDGAREAPPDRPSAPVSVSDRPFATEYIDNLDKLKARVQRSTDDIYRKVISDAVNSMRAGEMERREAIQRSLDRFARNGISGFVDKAGRRWGMAEYAEMAIRTGMKHAALAGYTDDAINSGYDLVLTTDHADTCPLCMPWERKVLSLTGRLRHDPACDGLLSDAIEAGLFHPNCWHSFSIYVPGASVMPPPKKQTPEQDERGYNVRQRMRYCERQIRKFKRLKAVAATPEAKRHADAYIRRWNANLNEVSKESGIAKARGRTSVYVPNSARSIRITGG